MFPFLSLALGAVSTGLQIFGATQQASGEEKQSEALLNEETARHKQFTLDFQRQRIEAVRNSIITRSLAVQAGASQGALNSSSVRSGAGNAANRAAYQIEGLNQNQAIGEEVFQARREYYDAGGQVAFGQGLSTLGATIGSNVDTLSKLGTFALGKIGAQSQPMTSSSSDNSSLYSLGVIH